jgi:hypothetical protein
MRGRVAIALVAALASSGVRAEQLYVIDKLVISLFSEPNGQGERVTTLETGDAVESLERDGSSVHVRLTDGREGWIGANYLSSQAPASVRLKELEGTPAADAQAQVTASEKKYSDEIARLQKQNTSLKEEVEKLKKAPPPAVAVPIVNPAPEPPPVEERPVPSESAVVQTTIGAPWWGLFVAAFAAAALGFAVGYARLARLIRRKYGSLRIY